MSDIIEPPVLLSRLMTFVFAAVLVVVVVLVITLTKMYPLEKTQILFLTTQPLANTEIRISTFSPDNENMELYKQAFIKEYLNARNEIIPNVVVMQKKWGNDEEGRVNRWSTPEVYSQFMQTQMWKSYMDEAPDFEFYCPVEFNNILPFPGREDTYIVKFRYFCTNTNGQADNKDSTIVKDFTIVIRLELDNIVKWTDRLHNPLGIRVAEYSVESDGGDPLEFNWALN
ncbi:MAG: hypothetical protein LBD50_01985 [Rickettsiales bacterium]|nr:hypothetical protein [Rickettsiales bacterium]